VFQTRGYQGVTPPMVGSSLRPPQSASVFGASTRSGYSTRFAPPAAKPKPPPSTKPLFLKFHDLSEDDLNRIAAAESKSEARRLLKEGMRIDRAEGYRKEILGDLHFHNYVFCQSLGFGHDKTSTFLSIMKLLLEEASRERLTIEAAADVFKAWLLKHGVERPPKSIGVFSFEDVKSLTDYVHNTFFRHYQLYMYVYTTRCNLHVRIEPDNVATSAQVEPVISSRIAKAPPIVAEEEVDPSDQPELADLFKTEEVPQNEGPEDRAAIIKRKVDEGIAKLMEQFEEQLKEQDGDFRQKLEDAKKG